MEKAGRGERGWDKRLNPPSPHKEKGQEKKGGGGKKKKSRYSNACNARLNIHDPIITITFLSSRSEL